MPQFTRAMFIDLSDFCEQFLKRFWKSKFFSEFLHAHIVQEAPIHHSHVY